MPPSAHEFALMDMAYSQGDAFALARHEPGRNESAHLFFPGCQFCASAPGQVVRVYDHLRVGLSDGVGLMLDCCAAPALWAGRQDLFEPALARFREKWAAMGSPRICRSFPSGRSWPTPICPVASIRPNDARRPRRRPRSLHHPP